MTLVGKRNHNDYLPVLWQILEVVKIERELQHLLNWAAQLSCEVSSFDSGLWCRYCCCIVVALLALEDNGYIGHYYKKLQDLGVTWSVT